MRPILPVLLNEILWSLGITAYQVIYARLGTEQLAAVQISTTITDLAVVAFIGLGNATAILVGNLIGSGKQEQAQVYAGRSLLLSFLGSLVLGLLLLLLSPFILTLYKVSPEVIGYARTFLLISASFLWLRMMNLIIFIGIFRCRRGHAFRPAPGRIHHLAGGCAPHRLRGVRPAPAGLPGLSADNVGRNRQVVARIVALLLAPLDLQPC